MINFPIGDFLIRIKNAAISKNREIEVEGNKFIINTAECLKKLGYLDSVEAKEGLLRVKLSFRNKKPVLSNIKLISKPGLRVYSSVDELESLKGPSIYLISTPKGVVSAREAIKQRTGGEVIAEVL